MSDHLSVSLATTGSSEHPVRLKTSDDSVSGSDTAAAIAEAPKGHDDESDFTGQKRLKLLDENKPYHQHKSAVMQVFQGQ